MKPRDAFAICHEIYVVARELVDSRLPTTQLQTSSKFLWRPDLHPRLVEYVADFARAGERALEPAPAARGAHRPLRASRMILFRMHYLGGLEYERARRMLGNFPQAFSHVALVNSGINLMHAQAMMPKRNGRKRRHVVRHRE